MALLVTSAAAADGDGYGALLSFGGYGNLRGRFASDSRLADPRGLAVNHAMGLLFLNSGTGHILAIDGSGTIVRDTGPIASLNPGGGSFGPDGRYYVELRTARTIMAFPPSLDLAAETIVPTGIVPFPRGFAFGRDGRLFLASGIGPEGSGDNTILAFDPSTRVLLPWRVTDPELSPLDLIIAPNGNILVSSEHPFGAPDAVTTIREYDIADAHLVRVFRPAARAQFRKPRGLRFGPDGHLYCVARDEVVRFHFVTGVCLGPIVRFPRLNGHALAFFA
jgi:DNA-binding beta-propeller fold protein YncE